MKLAGHDVSSAQARIVRTYAGLDGVPGPLVLPRPPARITGRPAELPADELPEDEAPPLCPDDTPDGWDGSRAERREPRGIGHLDLPWHGPIPHVGRSIHRLRAAWHNRAGRRELSWHTPVPVDVVPVIHQRAARGNWAARWSGARVVARLSHRTYAPVTTVAGAVAPLTLAAGQAVTTQATRDDQHGREPAELAERTVIDPTRGPTEGRLFGALAGLATGPP